jgi:hypothetical protein
MGIELSSHRNETFEHDQKGRRRGWAGKIYQARKKAPRQILERKTGSALDQACWEKKRRTEAWSTKRRLKNVRLVQISNLRHPIEAVVR